MKNIKTNMLINSLKSVLSILFPLITFPYISRVLGVENIGKYNYANSVVSYFVFFAALGITNYAVREGARIKDDKEKIEKFTSEMFTINLISSILSYVLLIICILLFDKLKNYISLIMILSFQILLQLIGKEWYFTIYEEYGYLTVRYIIVHIITLILMFIFVKQKNDYVIYAIITVIASSGANILNYLKIKKKINVKLSLNMTHLKPILYFFASSLAVFIYTNTDVAILGGFWTDYEVGIYSVSVKVYTIVISLLCAVVSSLIPRMAMFSKDYKLNSKKINSLACESFSIIIVLIFPIMMGIISLSREIILLIADKTFLSAVVSIDILIIASAFCIFGYFFGNAILIIFNREKFVLKITVYAAVINLVLNFLLIPFFKQDAAAFTTLVSQAVSCFAIAKEGLKYVDLKSTYKTFIHSIIASLVIGIIIYALRLCNLNMYIFIILSIIISAVLYFTILLLLKNELILNTLNEIKNKLKIR